jgi:hypothetical protein
LPESGFGEQAPTVSVGYDAAATPVSSNTRNESALLVGSMIRAHPSWRNTSSPPAAWSNPSTS